MALDTRIPLGIEQVNIANPLATLMQTRQNTQDRAIAAEDRQREIGRQSQQDQRQNAEFQQTLQLNAAKIDEFKNNKATQRYLQDSLTVKNLLESNNPQDAALVVQGMLERFKGTDYASGLDQDLANITSGNFEPVLSGINSELQVFQQMGKLAAPERQGMQKVAPGETLFDPNTNQAVFTAPEKPESATARPAATDLGKINQDFASGNITPDQYNQLIDTAIQEREAAAATGQAKVTEQQTREDMVKSEAGRILQLTQNLIGNEEGLAGATGPFSSMMPSFKEKTVDFEANIKELQDLLTMSNLGRMTGVLSESDIKLIANAASGLNMRASEGRMAIKLKDIQDRIAQRFPDLAASIFTERPDQSAIGQQPDQASDQPIVVNGYTIRRVGD